MTVLSTFCPFSSWISTMVRGLSMETRRIFRAIRSAVIESRETTALILTYQVLPFCSSLITVKLRTAPKLWVMTLSFLSMKFSTSVSELRTMPIPCSTAALLAWSRASCFDEP
ncbi:MAG: hypothetical protein ACD_75C02160G0003 [uncultured bacterium]|nr:MAG: hypothetical protein ACD_75C02160G0003 [uncultured bacterium]